MLVAVESIYAWQWPVDPPVFSGAFGDNTGEGFRKGDLLRSSGAAVGSVAPGQVIFAYQRDQRADALPSGLGNFVVIQHRQDFRSVYDHLAPGSIPLRLTDVIEGQTVGLSGESGNIEQPGVGLQILDIKRKRAVNPVAVLPPVADQRPPTITGAYLFDAAKFALTDGVAVPTGHWAVAAEISEHSQGGKVPDLTAPFGIELSVNDKIVTKLQFEYLVFRQDHYYIDPDYRWRFENLYLGPHTYDLGMIDLVPGMNTVKIRTFDFAGNESVLQQQVFYGQAAVGPSESASGVPTGTARSP